MHSRIYVLTAHSMSCTQHVSDFQPAYSSCLTTTDTCKSRDCTREFSIQGVPSTTASRTIGGDAKTSEALTPPKPKELVMTCLG